MLVSNKILAVDIGASTVKVAEFQPSRTHGLRLTNFSFADLGVEPDREDTRKALVITTLRNVLRERNIRTSCVIFSVSGQSVFTRFVKLPPVDESKVTQIIQYEAQQNVPFPIDEVIWDYQLIGSTERGELEVVLLAIKSDLIEDLNSGVESVGLRTEMVDVAPMALYNSVRYNEGDVEGCTMVVDIGARTTNLLFVEKGKLFARAIPLAGNAITQSIAAEFNIPFRDAEALKKAKGFVALGGAYEEPADPQQAHISKIIRNVMTKLHAEIGRSINFYRTQQGGSAPARLLLSGGSAVTPYADRFFKEKLQVPVELFNPFRNVEIDPRLSRDELGKCAHFFGEVVGLGLRKVTECPLEVNLLPKSTQRRQQMRLKQPFLAGAAVSALLIPLCFLAFTRKTANLKQEQLKHVQGLVLKMEALNRTLLDEKQRVEQLHAQADQVSTLLHTRGIWPELLQDIHGRLSPGGQETTNLWIVSLTTEIGAPDVVGTPVHTRGINTGRGSAAAPLPPPAELSGGKQTAITDLVLYGAGNHTENDLRLVDEFKQRLRKSPFVDKEGVEITVPPPPLNPEPVFTFTMRVRLKQAITF
jgi:type IV pilus assembly protein PilM